MKQKRLTKKEVAKIEEPESIEVIDSEINTETFLARLPLNLDLAGIFFISALININQGKREYQKLQKAIEA